jgi:Trk-type K+ transport system membrane component
MKKFFKQLLSADNETSSKRFAALVTLFFLIILTFMATLKDEKWITPDFMFEALALIAGSGLGLTVMEKIFTKYSPPKPEPPKEENPENPENQGD